MAAFSLDGMTKTRSGLIAIMSARLTVLTLFMVVLSLILPADSMAFYLFMALGYVITIPYALWLRDLRRSGRHLVLQFVVDLVLVTGLVYFSGGLDSDLCLLYPLIILSAGIVVGPKRAMQVAVLSSLTYGTLVVLTSQGVLMGYNGQDLPQGWLAVSKTVGWRVLVFLCFGVGASYLSRRCYYAEKGAAQLREMSEIIFRKVNAGLILLDAEGVVVKANEFACQLLGRTSSELEGVPMQSLIDDEKSAEIDSDPGDPLVRYVKRGDGSSVPITSDTSSVSLPASLFRAGESDENVDASILAFTDVSKILEMEDRVRRASHMQAAAHAASEIAHEIRNPLAVVSGAVEVLKRIESRSDGADDPKTMENERAEMYKQILSESVRLDETIERFINCAECSPEQVANILQIGDSELSERV